MPSPFELNSSLALIGMWLYSNSRPDLNCAGIKRGPKLEWVIVAKGYSIEVKAIGMDSQATVFKPDGKGDVTFSQSVSEASPARSFDVGSRGGGPLHAKAPLTITAWSSRRCL